MSVIIDSKEYNVDERVFGGSIVDEVIIVGFDSRRSDNSHVSRTMQERIFNMLLKEEASKEQVVGFVRDEINKVKDGTYKYSEIGIPKGITKNIGEYKVEGANIRGAKYAIEELKIALSTKPKMLYIKKMPDSLPYTDVLCFDEDFQVPPGTKIDMDKMLEKIIKDKMEAIFDALGWNLGEIDYHWTTSLSKKSVAGMQQSLFE